MTHENLYTMADWERDHTLKVEVGQIIVPEIYYQLLCALPPHRNNTLFQAGEAETLDWNTGKPLYKTFERMEGDYYKYIGLKP